jgi:hypothetical protein
MPYASHFDTHQTNGGVKAMNRKILGLLRFLAVTALVASTGVSAQQVTYDFTGIITSSDFGSITAGTTVNGTYTFNLGNADPNLSSNNPGSQLWNREVAGGTAYSSLNEPAQTGSVVSSSVTVGSPTTTTFANSGLSALGNTSGVQSSAAFYLAAVTDYTSASSYQTSSLSLIDVTDPFVGSTGLPVFGVTTTGTGEIEIVSNFKPGSSSFNEQQLDYSITSLSRMSAPEINPASAASGLTLLLGGLAVLRGRRKKAVA